MLLYRMFISLRTIGLCKFNKRMIWGSSSGSKLLLYVTFGSNGHLSPLIR